MLNLLAIEYLRQVVEQWMNEKRPGLLNSEDLAALRSNKSQRTYSTKNTVRQPIWGPRSFTWSSPSRNCSPSTSANFVSSSSGFLSSFTESFWRDVLNCWLWWAGDTIREENRHEEGHTGLYVRTNRDRHEPLGTLRLLKPWHPPLWLQAWPR